MQRICVFCGSNRGARPEYTAAARALASALLQQRLTLVYGGGRVGLMGELADAVLAGGGQVIGVIPRNLVLREVGHAGLTELRVVETMHERKALMADLADAFIALPGGLGTFEEVFEIWTWAQLGVHRKPVGFLDVAGYYAPLLSFLDHAVAEQFVRPQHRAIALVEQEPDALLARLRSYAPPDVEKWIDVART
ncbi:MAG TPA: TIGR00730 family Rossman fold protein [Thermoanaerobaculia bacterium]|nr:TIGR00730 family Rossman fold protein [Thermoanaerobaculia bacterium]